MRAHAGSGPARAARAQGHARDTHWTTTLFPSDPDRDQRLSELDLEFTFLRPLEHRGHTARSRHVNLWTDARGDNKDEQMEQQLLLLLLLLRLLEQWGGHVHPA